MNHEIPELIVSDLDGTLLRTDGTLSERSRRALASVAGRGIPVWFATGRPPRWLQPVRARPERSRPGVSKVPELVVCSNGAIVYDMAADRVLDRRPLSPEIGREVVRAVGAAVPEAAFAVEYGARFRYESGYFSGTDRPGLLDLAGWATQVVRADLFDEQAVKLLIAGPSHVLDLRQTAEKAVGDLAEVTHSGDGSLLEVSAAGVSKARTLDDLCAARGIDPGRVWAFGDMPNDVGMLTWAGRSYAMANAHPDAAAAATTRCPPNDEDGVAAILEHLPGTA